MSEPTTPRKRVHIFSNASWHDLLAGLSTTLAIWLSSYGDHLLQSGCGDYPCHPIGWME